MDVAAATIWVDERLAAARRRRRGDLVLHRRRDWGEVYRVDAELGPVWLKVPGPATRFEVALAPLLARIVPDAVLTPLGVDRERGWLLLPDGGPPLGDTEEVIDSSVLAAAMRRYAHAQRRLEAHVDDLLAAGVADMRPRSMPTRFDEALAAGRGLAARSGGPDDAAVLDAVADLRAVFAERCAALDGSPGPASLDHNDLHGANILGRPARPQTLRFYDWGDSVVAHPFASLLVPLGIASCLGPEHVEIVRDAYLEAYAHLAAPDELAATVDLACWVAKVARALVWQRALGDSPEPVFAGAVLEHLGALRTQSFALGD